MNAADKKMVDLAIGRIFGMMQRASAPGDVAEYERCRNLILDLIEDEPQPQARAPWPGWNFRSGCSGVVE